MCCVQEKVHSQFNVISPLEEKSEPGNLSQTERLKARFHEFWERGLPFCFLWQPIRAEEESVANSVTNPFITSLLSPQSLVPTCCSYLPLSKALAHHFMLPSWHCTSQADGRPIHVPEVTPALLWRCCKGCWASRAPSFLHTDCKGLL